MQHNTLMQWVNETALLCKPDNIYWCNGSTEEYATLCDALVKKGTFIPLDPQKWPDSFACFSHPSDVARVEDRTFICSRSKSAIESPVGWMPRYEHINWDGLNLERHDFNQLMDVDRENWKKELLEHEELFNRMYDKLPKELFFIRELLLSSLWRSPEHWEVLSEVERSPLRPGGVEGSIHH